MTIGNRNKIDNGVKYKSEKGEELFLNVDQDKWGNNSNCKTKYRKNTCKIFVDNLIEQTKTK